MKDDEAEPHIPEAFERSPGARRPACCPVPLAVSHGTLLFVVYESHPGDIMRAKSTSHK